MILKLLPVVNGFLIRVAQPVVGAVDGLTLILQSRADFVVGVEVLQNISKDVDVGRADDDRRRHPTARVQILEWLPDRVVPHEVPGEQQSLSLAVR